MSETREGPGAAAVASWPGPVRSDAVGRGVRLTTATGAVDVDVAPDFILAERLSGLARRRQLVELVVRGGAGVAGPTDGYGVLTATWHRLPQQRRIPLAAALALAVSGVPTHLRMGPPA